MLPSPSYKIFLPLFLPCLFASCKGHQQATGKPDPQRDFMAANGIVSCIAYESDCKGKNESRLSETHYNDSGLETDRTSYLMGGDVFSKTLQTYENGLVTEKIYFKTKTNPYSVARYEYNEKGQKIKYAIFDSLDHRVSLHKIERKGNKEYVSDYDAKGNLTNYRSIAYDSQQNPLIFATRKFAYTYNKDGLMTESASVDTLSGSFIRHEFEYRGVLRVKQTVYVDDSCSSIIRYEYKKTSGEKW